MKRSAAFFLSGKSPRDYFGSLVLVVLLQVLFLAFLWRGYPPADDRWFQILHAAVLIVLVDRLIGLEIRKRGTAHIVREFEEGEGL